MKAEEGRIQASRPVNDGDEMYDDLNHQTRVSSSKALQGHMAQAKMDFMVNLLPF